MLKMLSPLFTRCWQTLFAIYLLLLSVTAIAWDSTGHRIISTIAYTHLTPQVRQVVDRLSNLSDPGYPPLVRFAYSSTLPDQWRKDDRNQSSWHFINYPWSPDHTPTRPVDSINLVTILEKNEAILVDTEASDRQKATALAYVTHLVGDAHQPLHCSNRFTAMTPQGDYGGNIFSIKGHHAHNLHTYWDQIARLFVTDSSRSRYPLRSRQIKAITADLQQRYPISHFGDKAYDLSARNWTQQSFSLAQQAYATLTPKANIPAQYASWASQTAQTQMVLAGYRLANLLNQQLSVAVD